MPNKRVCVITGDICKRHGIDVWVNSENTNMQMSRFYDKTLSGMIRCEGAEKDENEQIVADTIARTFIAPRELPVGAITALIGAPLFIYLLRRV